MRSFASSSGTRRRVAAALTLITLGGLSVALISPVLARKEGFAGQYQIRQIAVSRTAFTAVSPVESGEMSARFSSDNALEIPQNNAGKVRLDLVGQTEAVQYQTPESRHGDRRLMLRIALGLGLAYAGFVAWWMWATRLRSRPPRIDTWRRID
jgi:hypothetical protein